jgi:hypothetical protein
LNDYQDLEQADVISTLEAHLRGDVVAINALVALVNPYALFAGCVGFLVEALGEHNLRDHLAAWRQSHGSVVATPPVWGYVFRDQICHERGDHRCKPRLRRWRALHDEIRDDVISKVVWSPEQRRYRSPITRAGWGASG